jgi:hypothetical protein
MEGKEEGDIALLALVKDVRSLERINEAGKAQ